MCGQMRHTILADRRLIGHPSGGCSQTRRFKGPAEPRCSSRQQAGSSHAVAHRALSSASIHSPSARSAYGVGNDAPRMAPHHPPSVRAQNSAPTAVGCRGAIRKMVRHPHRRARRAARECQFPPSVFPPLETPLSPPQAGLRLIPPPNSNPPKGGKPQGALVRRLVWRG
jgi:hypothetical protein